MAWQKSTPEATARFEAALPSDPAARRRKMFGFSACFVNGNFFVGMHEDNVVARLPDGLRGKFPVLATATAFDPLQSGKGMKDWWLIPPAVINDQSQLQALIAAMFVEIRRLPPKAPKRPYKKSSMLKAGTDLPVRR